VGQREPVTSSPDRMMNRLSVAATISLVLMVVATATYVGWPRVAGAMGIKPSAPQPAYVAGQTFDAPSAWYADASHTLVIFARASCTACEKAQPFLKELVGAVGDKAAVVMAHPPGAPDEDADFARSLGIADDRIVIVGSDLRVKSTPTLVLVDQRGTVMHAWEGVGPVENQAKIAEVLKASLK